MASTGLFSLARRRNRNASANRLPAFPQFSQLPIEIRDLIWNLALPGPRVINVNYQAYGVTDDDGSVRRRDGHIAAQSDADVPMLRTCKESRAIALRVLELSFVNHLPRPIYFNHACDVLLFNGPEALKSFFNFDHTAFPLPSNSLQVIGFVPMVWSDIIYDNFYGLTRSSAHAIMAQLLGQFPYDAMFRAPNLTKIFVLAPKGTIHETWGSYPGDIRGQGLPHREGFMLRYHHGWDQEKEHPRSIIGSFVESVDKILIESVKEVSDTPNDDDKMAVEEQAEDEQAEDENEGKNKPDTDRDGA